MNFDDYFGPQENVIDLLAQDRWLAIEELMNHLVDAHKIQSQHRDRIAADIRKRELAMSTGIGFGIALPHASTDLVSEVVAVAGRSQAGIRFDAPDGKPVHLVFLFLIPTGQFQNGCESWRQPPATARHRSRAACRVTTRRCSAWPPPPIWWRPVHSCSQWGSRNDETA